MRLWPSAFIRAADSAADGRVPRLRCGTHENVQSVYPRAARPLSGVYHVPERGGPTGLHSGTPAERLDQSRASPTMHVRFIPKALYACPGPGSSLLLGDTVFGGV